MRMELHWIRGTVFNNGSHWKGESHETKLDHRLHLDDPGRGSLAAAGIECAAGQRHVRPEPVDGDRGGAARGWARAAGVRQPAQKIIRGEGTLCVTG